MNRRDRKKAKKRRKKKNTKNENRVNTRIEKKNCTCVDGKYLFHGKTDKILQNIVEFWQKKNEMSERKREREK